MADNLDYNILRTQLILVAKELDACDPFLEKMKSIKDAKSFKDIIVKNYESILEHFDVDLGDDDGEDKDDKIDDLESEISDLESELTEYKNKVGCLNSLHDEYKITAFKDNKDKYAYWELQELLENGHKYLKGELV